MRPLVLVWMAGAVFAQGTAPKEKPEAYPVHAESRSAVIGAEFMVHSFSGGEESYVVKGYLVVEVALFPRRDQMVDVHSGNFVLRVNGRKHELLPQPVSMVTASMAHPEWNQTGPRVEADAGAGGATVGLGHPRQVGLPGQNVPPVARDDRSGVPQRERVKPEDLLVQTSLPQGEHRGPVSGFLYFAYTGRTAAIKSLELSYENAVLKLR